MGVDARPGSFWPRRWDSARWLGPGAAGEQRSPSHQWAYQRSSAKVAITPLGILVALVFVGLPFVVRTLEPVVMDLPREAEEAAATLGASRIQTLRRVVLPALTPVLLTGFAAALARGIGENGSVLFIAGNKPMISEIAPLLIVIRLEQLGYAGAAALALVMLLASFAIPAAAQPVAGAHAPSRSMSRTTPPSPTDEHPAARLALIGLTIVLLLVVLLLPMLVVLIEALSRGVGAVLTALADPDSIASIELTMLVAAVSVPLNTVCGLAGARCIGRFRFRGRGLLITLIELPFSVAARSDGHLRARRPLSRPEFRRPTPVGGTGAGAGNRAGLLLDEPFGALDAKVRKSLRIWLRDLQVRMGLTTIFVTHDQAEALEMADRVAVLRAGRIEQVDAPDRLDASPVSACVHEFLGESIRLDCSVAAGRRCLPECHWRRWRRAVRPVPRSR
jgi:ABC-type sulfate transport system permease component